MALSAGADQNQTTSRILNKLGYAMTDIAADITEATTSDIFIVLDASDNYEVKYGDSANLNQMLATAGRRRRQRRLFSTPARNWIGRYPVRRPMAAPASNL